MITKRKAWTRITDTPDDLDILRDNRLGMTG
jgi:hypothetical protein